MPRDTLQIMNRLTRHKTERQRFIKLKEVQANAQANAFAPHLILPQRTQAHPPPITKLTIK
jgi:hypothetical protein